MVFSEVSRGHSKPETSCNLSTGSGEVSQKEEGPNVRMVTGSQSNWHRRLTTETHKRTTCMRVSRKLRVDCRRSLA
jgi:hypothetical protein